MFCPKCGNQVKEGTKFCSKCGTPLTVNTASNNNKTEIVNGSNLIIQNNKEPKKGNKIITILLLAIVAIGLLGLIAFLFFSAGEERSREDSFTGQMSKAEEYMDKDKYEDAIGYYKAALDVDPEEEDAYLGLAKAYMELDKEKEALKILRTGYEITGSDDIKEYFEELFPDESIEESDGGADSDDSEEELEKYTGEKTDINIEVRQVDNSNFPQITLYASITDLSGNTVEELKRTDFNISEINGDGQVVEATIDDVYQVLNEDNINVNLVLDASGSMDSYNKMQQAKNAANAFVDQIDMEAGDKVEVISFDDFVYLEQEFSSQKDIVKNAVNGIDAWGSTALYDAIYAGLFQTYYEDGAKCVIAFTDGMENASSYTYEDVVYMAQNTGIPVFIIGIGEEYDAAALQSLAYECSGKYYSANVNDLETILEDIYVSIYREQQDYYVFKYTTSNMDNPTEFRDIVIETSDTTEFSGSYRKTYKPQAEISGAFSDSYMNLDFMIDVSSQRVLTENDLAGLSLAQLRIARNEIFARHGRQFRDSMLNQWFYAKTWYLNLPYKYSPDDFDAINPSPLSRIEIDNANFIKAYEDNIMMTQDIYPNASTTLLSDYDLALSKAVLKNALAQMQTYNSTDILNENIRLVQEAINKEDVQY